MISRFFFFVLLMFMGSICFATIASAQTWLNPEGMTVETRFIPPEGFTRKQADDPYVEYVRNLPMLPNGSPVRIYTGDLKPIQNHHVGVLDIDVGNRDLQQCSDAAQRIRTDYLFSSGQDDKISYQFANGMEFPWKKWREGWRVKREGKKTVMVKSAKADKSANAFKNYQKMLFMYAGVSSVMRESPVITIAQMRPGDVIAGVGHLIIILDVVENQSGEKKFLLAQSYIPAQQIEVLKQPHTDNPWYDAKSLEQCPFLTPEWQYYCPDGAKIYRLR